MCFTSNEMNLALLPSLEYPYSHAVPVPCWSLLLTSHHIEASELGEITPSKYAIMWVASFLSFSLPLRRDPGKRWCSLTSGASLQKHAVYILIIPMTSEDFESQLNQVCQDTPVYSLYISGYPQYIPCTSQDTPVYSSILTVHISESICQGISIFCATDEGYWKGGTFSFKVTVPEEYNIKVSHVYPVILCCHDQSHKSFLQPPHVVCRTRLWHPNINETGEVCLRYAHHRTRSCSKSPEAFWFSLPLLSTSPSVFSEKPLLMAQDGHLQED